jgi:hypothetical protein
LSAVNTVNAVNGVNTVNAVSVVNAVQNPRVRRRRTLLWRRSNYLRLLLIVRLSNTV